ncbi:MAG: hypothetical protein KDD73_16180, partial [Anaerolineales bacterium]|nr:hypothetical protein [Anaerolineales bacterium]
MGGRGRASDGYYLAQMMTAQDRRITLNEQRHSRGYSALSVGQQPPGVRYPFLDGSGRAWRLLTYDVATMPEPLASDTFGRDKPTLRWVGDGGVHDLYVDGMETEAFLAQSGLRLDMAKGGFVLSKRLSRLMRPFTLQNSFASDDVHIGYLQQDAAAAKVWDGAGLINRTMLERLLPTDLDPVQRQRLARELAHAGRVEFTIMTAKGQDKGHAMVVDELRDAQGRTVDFLLPEDTKQEISLHDGSTFVGIGLVHSKSQMRLDIQSLIHLSEFFDHEMLLRRLSEEGALFRESVESGTAGQAMARIDGDERVEDVRQWHLREFLASGGDLRWFGGPAKTLLGQHLKRLNESTRDKLRLPLPGGRFYVMPAGVGEAGELDITLPRGHIHLDPARGTAWVNDADWLQMPDSPTGAGLADIWGGADNDDALWLYPFTDRADGERKVLAWRSPNQLGEYVVLKPTAASPDLVWQTTDGSIAYPEADSRQLPARIDRREQPYLDLLTGEAGGGVGEGQSYSIQAMEVALTRAEANSGALGMYCNALMLHKALFYTLPEEMPAPLEDVIDGTVKTGADLSAIKEWCYQHTRDILEAGVHVPERLRRRLSLDRDAPPWELVPPVRGSHGQHELDRLDVGVDAHITSIQEVQQRVLSETMPPARLFDAAFDDPESIRLGARYNQRYAATLKQVHKERQGKSIEDQAQAEVDTFLSAYSAQEQWSILRRHLFQDAWRDLARGRPSSSMGEWDRAEALRRADEALSRLNATVRERELRGRLLRQAQFRLEQEHTAALTDVEQEHLRERMENFLEAFPPDRQRAILRGALVSLRMRDAPGSDAALWLPGPKTDDGQQLGIAQKT